MILSVIIPVYNEEHTIQKIVDKVRKVDIPKEIIIVDDCSLDRSREIISGMTDVRIVLHSVNRGKGAAIRTGLEYVSGDVVVIQDGDLEYDPADFLDLIAPILDDEADVVYGSRFLGKTEGMRFRNLLGNKVLTLITNILYGARITDMETCYKMIRVSILGGMDLRANRFDFEPEITAKLLKRKVRFREVPISYRGRTHDEGKKIGWKDGVHAIWSLLRYRFTD